MADVIVFPRWMRLEPIYLQPDEINVIVIYNFLDQEVPRPTHLSIFEHKWLDRIVGYRHRESFNYLNDTRNFYDARTTISMYGTAAMPENVRFEKHG